MSKRTDQLIKDLQSEIEELEQMKTKDSFRTKIMAKVRSEIIGYGPVTNRDDANDLLSRIEVAISAV